MNKDIQISIIDREGKIHIVSVPIEMNFNLMEICKLNNISVQGTCGGMAMCSSCQCYIISNHKLPKKNDDEIAMLSNSIHVRENSRLGCQLPITTELEGLEIEIAPD